ncbi:hypothetical protein QJQ45_015831, partial [Haematococcus lacustris]
MREAEVVKLVTTLEQCSRSSLPAAIKPWLPLLRDGIVPEAAQLLLVAHVLRHQLSPSSDQPLPLSPHSIPMLQSILPYLPKEHASTAAHAHCTLCRQVGQAMLQGPASNHAALLDFALNLGSHWEPSLPAGSASEEVEAAAVDLRKCQQALRAAADPAMAPAAGLLGAAEAGWQLSVLRAVELAAEQLRAELLTLHPPLPTSDQQQQQLGQEQAQGQAQQQQQQ